MKKDSTLHYIKKIDLLGTCFSLSVSGTYITPINLSFLIVPSDNLSYCSNHWLPPTGPTGITKRPPGLSCSINWKRQNLCSQIWINYTYPYTCTCTSEGVAIKNNP